ncbi:metal ABC transporter solute-binding protein, Zn/Mn family [Methylobrevis pamukkalensis]|uniref:Putative periplasmic iron-binding protein n=1 Tax=Methylobrevis pamukkalensis TaxID=1439726 RepID=A0A1E3H328_9HYPH|nr:zinc ABC transporter substrate-binding protein [Methylobrevis pamukkalensis]ODN70733.1 putative periplasmic iron-binding protein precursor [Methylobrevis pamukkalensis]
MTRPTLLAGTMALALSALVSGSAFAKDLQVVATFTVLGDVVKAVGGDKVTVTTLIGPNGDAHEFAPSPADASRLKAADLVFMSGLGLEGFMERLISASGYGGTPVVASEGIRPREMEEADHDAHEGHTDHDAHDADAEHDTHASDDAHAEHDHGEQDPHVWNDPANVEIWVANIEKALAAADPEDAATFAANAAAYVTELKALDAYARETIGAVPAERRKILTSHDAFGYFGAAYGVTLLSPVGLSTEAEASAADVAKLIDQIRAEGVKAYFVENSSDPRLVSQIAEATGAQPGGELYVESLSGPDGPAPTYLKMLRHNVDEIAKALGTSS